MVTLNDAVIVALLVKQIEVKNDCLRLDVDADVVVVVDLGDDDDDDF